MHAMRFRSAQLLGAVMALLLCSCVEEQVGPAEPAWDRAVCAHCSMHIGEPSFAAQELVDSQRRYYDDPGCWVLDGGPGRPGPTWFHHLHEDRWLAEDAVAFVAVQPTPMGFGHGAVQAGEADALSLEQFIDAVEERHGDGRDD